MKNKMSGTGKALSIYSKIFGMVFYLVLFIWIFAINKTPLDKDSVIALALAASFFTTAGIGVDISMVAKNALQKSSKNLYNQDDKQGE